MLLRRATTHLSIIILEVEFILDLSISNIVKQLSNSIANNVLLEKLLKIIIWENHCRHYSSMIQFKVICSY